MKEIAYKTDDVKILRFEQSGAQYFFLYSGQAMFDIDDIIGAGKISEALSPLTKDGFKKLCRVAALLSEQGELARRYMGYDPAPMLTEETLLLFTPPQEEIRLYNAVMSAWCLGWGQDLGEKVQEVSLTRADIMAKKKEG